MEDILTQFLNSGPVGIVSAAVVYLIIALQRNSTKKSRDTAADSMDTRVKLLESEIKRLKDLDLDARLASIETSLKYIQMLLEGKQK
jgi:hypothetical protein